MFVMRLLMLMLACLICFVFCSVLLSWPVVVEMCFIHTIVALIGSCCCGAFRGLLFVVFSLCVCCC